MQSRPSDAEIQRRLLNYLRPHRKSLVAGLLCAAGTAGISAAIGPAIKNTLDAMATGRIDQLNTVCLLVIAAFAVNGVLSYGQTYFLSSVAQKITATLRQQIFTHLHSLSLAFFNQRRTGALLSILNNDVPVIQNSTMSIRDLVAAPLTILVSFGILFYTSWRLTLAAIVVVPMMGYVINRIGKRIRLIQRQIQERLSDLSSVTEETVAGVRIIKSFAAEKEEVARYSRENDLTYQALMKGIQKNAQLKPIIEFLGAVGIAAVIWFGGHEIAANLKLASEGKPLLSGLTAGGLGMFVYLLQGIARSIRDLGGINSMRQSSLSAAARIFEEILDQKPEVVEYPNAKETPPIKGRIAFENVSFGYSEGSLVLRDISFEAEPGEVVAVVGLSGAGKSTLVDLIPRFYDVTSGRIVIDGHDIRELKLESLRRQIGIVPQETWLFAGTLRSNIAYGRRNATEEEIERAAYAANAYFIEGMSARFETVVGERGIRLSGGERQRIAIARAILMNPRILILDEATSSLDASSEALVQEALDELMKGRTTVVIAHRLSTILNANKILVMEHGKIVASGTHNELIAQGGLYARLYERQFRAELQE